MSNEGDEVEPEPSKMASKGATASAGTSTVNDAAGGVGAVTTISITTGVDCIALPSSTTSDTSQRPVVNACSVLGRSVVAMAPSPKFQCQAVIVLVGSDADP